MTTLAARIIAAMQAHGYRIDKNPGEVNIAYVEGVNADGTPDGNKPNQFNDMRFVIRFENGEPIIVGSWDATTEPSKYWTEHPMNPGGAARIKFGQYHSWQVGIHHNNHEALVQRAPVTVYRDKNQDYKREGDKEDTGLFGINQHWGYDLPSNDLGTSSAGCLVGRTKTGHKQFMSIVKSDPRYVADKNFVFWTAIMPASDIAETQIPKPTEKPVDPKPIIPEVVSDIPTGLSINRKMFFDNIRANIFGGSLTPQQVGGISAILDEWEKRKYTDLRWLAYMLATVRAEVGFSMVPVREGFKATDADARKYVRDHGYKYAKVVNGQVYYGRGLVQLTWDYNYKKMGDILGIDLLNNPDKALVPAIAAQIMFEGMTRGTFTGKKLAQFFVGATSDWENARTIINGHDRAADIAAIAKKFHAALTASYKAAPVGGQKAPQAAPMMVDATTSKVIEEKPAISTNKKMSFGAVVLLGVGGITQWFGDHWVITALTVILCGMAIVAVAKLKGGGAAK